MKIPTILGLLLAVAAPVVDARGIYSLRFRELDAKMDLIVVATPVSTVDTTESMDLPRLSPAIPVVGLSSEFEVVFVLKGDTNLKKVVVHHYRLVDPKLFGCGLPYFATFVPKESARYLLFLKREADGRYAPYDQVDPAWNSILKLTGPEWDKMTSDDFKKWLAAKRWLDEQPTMLLMAGKFSPEITAEDRGEGSLHEAAFNGKLAKAQALIKENPGLVNSHDSTGSVTPLQLAVQFGQKDVAELLLASQADVEAKSYGDWTPLLNAVLGGHKDMVELLLAHKADITVQDKWQRTLLHVAAENGHTEIAALLLANKVNVDSKNSDGMTPLQIAVVFDHEALVELLVAHHADINLKDNQGRTALGIAVANKHSQLAEWLRQHGGHE